MNMQKQSQIINQPGGFVGLYKTLALLLLLLIDRWKRKRKKISDMFKYSSPATLTDDGALVLGPKCQINVDQSN